MAKLPANHHSGVPRSESEQLVRWYAEARKRLREMILHPTGTEAGQAFRQSRAALLIEQIDRIIRELDARSARWASKNLPAAYKDGIQAGLRQLEEAGVRVPGNLIQGSFSLVDRRSLDLLAQDTLMTLRKASGAMAESAKSVLRQTAQIGLSERQINDIIAGGIIEGTPRETIRTLREELQRVNADQLVKVIDKNGNTRHYEPGYYADMVVRTKTREVVVKARHNRLNESGVDLVIIIGKPSDNFCSAFLGQIFSLSGNHPKYPAYSSLPGGGPPFHPKCSKGTRPFVEALADPDDLPFGGEGLPDAKTLLQLDPAQAQRAYQDLQLRQQVEKKYLKWTKES